MDASRHRAHAVLLGAGLAVAACSHAIPNRITAAQLPIGPSAYKLGNDQPSPAAAIVEQRLQQLGWTLSKDADLTLNVSLALRPQKIGVLSLEICGTTATWLVKPRTSGLRKNATLVSVTVRIAKDDGQTLYAETAEAVTDSAHSERQAKAAAASLLVRDPRLVATDIAPCQPVMLSRR